MKYKEICGEVIDLFHDKKIDKLNAELAVTELGAPVIVLQDWTKEEESEDLVMLHLKDAMRLKAVFDSLIIDATLHNKEYVQELIDEAEKVD